MDRSALPSKILWSCVECRHMTWIGEVRVGLPPKWAISSSILGQWSQKLYSLWLTSDIFFCNTDYSGKILGRILLLHCFIMMIIYDSYSQYFYSFLIHVCDCGSPHIRYSPVFSTETFSLSYLQHYLLLWLDSLKSNIS